VIYKLGDKKGKMIQLIHIEIAGFLGVLVLGVIWAATSNGNLEPYTMLCGLIGVASELVRRYNKRKPQGRFESNAERIQHREKLRKDFEEEIYKCRAKNLRQDVIVRHVDRVDNYPNTYEDEKGISAWFRVALLDTYERGIILGLRYGGLVECEGGYRFADWVNGEKADIRVILMGDVPYDSIEAVNMDGDKYYYFPHIYCHFDFNGEPYERLWFCEKIDEPHGHPYFKHIADYKNVIANNPEDTLSFA